MAGSYRHCVTAGGAFRGTELLDHLGDAYEALEEMYDMIQFLSGGNKETIYLAWRDGHHAKRNAERLRAEPALFSYEEFWSGEDDGAAESSGKESEHHG